MTLSQLFTSFSKHSDTPITSVKLLGEAIVNNPQRAEVLLREMDGEQDEYILCAANWFKDGNTHVHQPKNVDSGFVVCGRRHHNCYSIASFCLADSYSQVKGTVIQGFITNKDRFVDRKEAYQIAKKANQLLMPDLHTSDNEILTSEDLY